MFRRHIIVLLSACLTVPGLVMAEDLSAEQIARIQRDTKAARDQVNAAHGNKKSSEMSTAERRQIIQEEKEATRAVMDKHGVSDKDFARQTARMGPKQNAEVAAADKALREKEKAAAASKEPEPGEVQVQEGFNDERPVILEEQEGALPSVEHGIPESEQVPTESS